MRFGPEICTDFSVACRKEWLETNGLGGYASSTIIGCNTRRYHGLLVAATRPPVGRLVLLSKLEETLVAGGGRHELSTNRYPGVLHPEGFRLQQEFRLDPFPVSVFSAGGVDLEKSVFMVHGENTTVVRYRALGNVPAQARVELRPLVAFRDYHGLTHVNPQLDATVHSGPGWIAFEPYPGLPRLYLNHSGAEIAPSGVWYYRFQYEEELARGLDWEEDLFCPCAITFDLTAGEAVVIVSTQVRPAAEAEDHVRREAARREELTRGWEPDPLARDLVRAADQFAVRRGDHRSIAAGYPWFTDWGRDAMIALEGLAIVPRRIGLAHDVLIAFAEHFDRGMIPNCFPDGGEPPRYNSVDATLWFFQAVHALAAATGDYEFVRDHLFGALLNSIDWHLRGTRHGIRAADDGLLDSGEPGVQLTWMDARVGDRVVTPRSGRPVEVQALWYNALRIVEQLAGKLGDSENAARHRELAARAKRSFNRQFWNPGLGCLYDCIDGDMRDASIRPNQILAVALPYSMLSREKMRAVMDVVTRELLTPFGLRSLSPRDPAYIGVYEGDPARRDASYHQGTVWPWLLGLYVTALLRAKGATARTRREARALLEPIRVHLEDAGLGSVSEIFDGDAPHAPRGCIAQAWSVGAILRALVETRA
jgi:predicted glycogen debranching enzyme